jgi:hypothetical protein
VLGVLPAHLNFALIICFAINLRCNKSTSDIDSLPVTVYMMLTLQCRAEGTLVCCEIEK